METSFVAKYAPVVSVEDGNTVNDEEMSATPVIVSVADEICSASPWTDTYFDGDSSVIAVFDIDYEAYRDSITYGVVLAIIMLTLYPPLVVLLVGGLVNVYGFLVFWVCYIGGVSWPIYRKLTKVLHKIYGIHVALTTEGIRQDSNGFPFPFRHSTLVRSTPQNRIPVLQYLFSQ
jgi:hypothetical protein